MTSFAHYLRVRWQTLLAARNRYRFNLAVNHLKLVLAKGDVGKEDRLRFLAGRQVQRFENKTKKSIEVYVEIVPDQYVLRPDDVMDIFYLPGADGGGLHSIVYEDGGIQIYLENFDTAEVHINGERAEPWSEKI